MDHSDKNNDKKGSSAIIGITGSVLSLVGFTARKALADSETREKIIDTFFEIKKKLSDSKRNSKEEHWEKTNLGNATSTDK